MKKRTLAAVLVSLYGAHTGTPASASETLLEKGGCVGCHRLDEKLIGPSLRDVAARYRDDHRASALLFDKVRNGSEGVWGDMLMPPKSVEHFSDRDLSAVIDWILQLQ